MKMKIFRIILLVVSVFVFFILLYAIVNIGVSYKYEIEDRLGEKVDISWVGVWMREVINVLKCFFMYVVVNIIYIFLNK